MNFKHKTLLLTLYGAPTERKTMSISLPQNERYYEGVCILHPDTSESDQKAFFQKNKSIIEDHKGELHHVDTWGSRKIGTPIKKVRRGYFFHYTFKSDNKAVEELERLMRINDKVLRFMHTRLDKIESLDKYLDGFKSNVAASLNKEKEREAKKRARDSGSEGRRH